MIALQLFIFVALIWLYGWQLLLLWPESDRAHPAVLAWALGGSAITLQLFIIKFILGWPLDWRCLVYLLVGMIALHCYHRLRHKQVWPKLQLVRFSRLQWALLIMISAIASIQVVHVWATPIINFDAVADWALRMKGLWFHQADLFNPTTWSHWQTLGKGNYPWHLSLLGWLLNFCTGAYQASWLNLIPWLYYVGLLGACYGLARERLDRSWSLGIVLMVAMMPLIAYHGSNYYADLPLTFYVAVILLVWRTWLSTQTDSSLWLTVIIGALALSLKIEALIIVGLIGALTMFKLWQRRAWSLLIKVVVVFGLLASPWYLWLWSHGLSLRNIAPGLAWHGNALKPIASSLFASQNWHLWWYLVALALAFSFTKLWRQVVSRDSVILFALLFLVIVIIFTMTEAYVFALGNETLSRTLMWLVPVSVAVLSDALAIIFSSNKNR